MGVSDDIQAYPSERRDAKSRLQTNLPIGPLFRSLTAPVPSLAASRLSPTQILLMWAIPSSISASAQRLQAGLRLDRRLTLDSCMDTSSSAKSRTPLSDADTSKSPSYFYPNTHSLVSFQNWFRLLDQLTSKLESQCWRPPFTTWPDGDHP